MNGLAEAIAFYLPQYHPFPENDQHWGVGFTEWNNVVRARPLFPGHYQPHLPADLGFYDLRVPEVRAQQRELAASAGISAFALYHYWFEGKRLMDRPVDDFFSDDVSDLKYLLCWANESWTLEWKNQQDWTTIAQTYSAADDRVHAEHIVTHYMLSGRYFEYDSRPVFLVYNPFELPEDARMVRVLREVAAAHGLDPLVGGCVAFEEGADPRQIGFDFSVRWAPNWILLRQAHHARLQRVTKIQNKLLSKRWPRFRHNEVFEYAAIIREHLSVAKQPWPTCDTVFPSWDNTARRAHGDAIVVVENDPEQFEAWIRSAVGRLRPGDPNLVFINAWNEWAEGCHLEPDAQFGHQWLEACRHVFT